MWRRRVEVESTIRPAKGRIAGFEGRGSHRTPFASAGSIAGEEKRFRRGGLTVRKYASTVGRDRSIAQTAACATDSGWGGFYRGALRTNQGGDEVVEGGAGAYLIIGMRRGHADFPIRKKLASETFAQNEELDRIAERNFAEVQGDVFFSPGHVELGLDGVERNFLRQFLKAFLV